MIIYELSLLIFFLVATVIILTSKEDGCQLKWNATYHMNGHPALIKFNETWIDTLGYCIASSSNQQNYIFRFELNNDICYRCVAIFNVHPNVLQYKQSECIKQYENSNDDIDITCRFAFRGDTPMKTLFRSDAKSEQCPFQPPFNFTYTIQAGSCTSRVSSANACPAYGKYRFHYEACPELPNYETHVDELECIANWNSFGIEFFAVRITNSSINRSNTVFRCLIHQKTTSGGHMGLSADSSCNELTDLTYAGTRIEYMQGSSLKSRCNFPSFLRHNRNFGKWISMATDSMNYFYSDKWIETVNGMNHSISQCLKMENIGNVRRMVVYKTTQQCTNGYQCIKMKRRHKNIVEITYDKLMDKMPMSCNLTKGRIIDTMVHADSQIIRCPFNRQHFIESCENSVAQFACTYDHELVMNLNCSNTSSEKFSCIGYWRENDIQYIVSRKSTSRELICHIYSSYEDDIIRIRSYHRSSCHSGSLEQHQPYHNYTFTKYDNCIPVSGVSMKARIDSSLMAIFILLSFGKTIVSLLTIPINRTFCLDMLGLVNVPSESVDFYAEPKNDHINTTIFGQHKKKFTISYTDDGRRIIDGKVENEKEPQEMWCNLLINLLIKNIFDGNIRNKHEQQINDSTELLPSINIDDIMMKSQITSHSTLSMLTAIDNVNSTNAINVKKKTNIMEKIILLMKKQIWWRK